jgi:hypothetical protein
MRNKSIQLKEQGRYTLYRQPKVRGQDIATNYKKHDRIQLMEQGHTGSQGVRTGYSYRSTRGHS